MNRQAKTEAADTARTAPQYAEGIADFDAGRRDSDCPYPIGDGRRVAWFTGWLDRRTNAGLGLIFRKYGLTHP